MSLEYSDGANPLHTALRMTLPKGRMEQIDEGGVTVPSILTMLALFRTQYSPSQKSWMVTRPRQYGPKFVDGQSKRYRIVLATRQVRRLSADQVIHLCTPTDVDQDDCDARRSYNVGDAADERTTRQSTRTVLSPPIEFVQYCWTRLAVDLPKKELHGYSIVADPLQNRACHSNSTQYDPREVKMRRR